MGVKPDNVERVNTCVMDVWARALLAVLFCAGCTTVSTSEGKRTAGIATDTISAPTDTASQSGGDTHSQLGSDTAMDSESNSQPNDSVTASDTEPQTGGDTEVVTDSGSQPDDSSTVSDTEPQTGGDTTMPSDAGPQSGEDTRIATDSDSNTNVTSHEPQTCEEAAEHRSYVGCEFWPTVTYNPVWTQFDFTVVVANGSDVPAEIVVSRGGTTIATTIIATGNLGSIPLPWVDALKGPVFETLETAGGRVRDSVRVDNGAYRLTSSVPVTVWQFNPLPYQLTEYDAGCMYVLEGQDRCLSVSNDASLLFPSTAMSGSYRVFGRSATNGGDEWGSTPMSFTVTATQDDTSVDIQFLDAVARGAGVSEASAGEIVTFSMNAGDAIQLLGRWGETQGSPHADLSGSVVLATKPVQIISSNPINNLPDESVGYADHIEESVLPGEVLGDEYIVVPPTGPDGHVPGHVVRFYGNVDGTILSYSSDAPTGVPTTLNAGDVVEIPITTTGFRVTGTDSFAVASFQIGGQLQDPEAETTRGDPAFSMMVTPKQFRRTYTFLAPLDYLESYADILLPTGTTVTIDGVAPLEAPVPVGDTGWSIVRHLLGEGNNGAHHLEADEPIGLQVSGYGHATAYYYPGGLNLEIITEPPEIIVIK